MSKANKYKVLAPLVALVLVLTLVPLSPITPVQAEVNSVTIDSPTGVDRGYVKPGGSLEVTFTVVFSETDNNADLKIEVLSGSTVIAFKDVDNVPVGSSPKTFNYSVTIPSTVAAGKYDLKVYARQPTGSGEWRASPTQSQAVVVDNTPPTVTLIQPNGGEFVDSDAGYTIKWYAIDDSPGYLRVTAQYSIDGGLTYTDTNIVNVSKAPWTNQEDWTAGSIPDVDNQLARIKLIVKDAAGNSTEVVSANNFTILHTQPTVRVSIPSSGTVWNGGSTQTISFTATSALNLNVDYKLEFYNGTKWTTITPGDGWVLNQPAGRIDYDWTVANNYAGTAAQIRATVQDKAGRTATATSPQFTIRDVTAPTVSITKPVAGDKVYHGVATNIEWTANDNVDGDLTYTWYLSTDGGTTWQLLGSSTEGRGKKTKPWSPNVTETKTNCKIKVTAKDAANNTGEAISQTFTIIYGAAVSPTVTLLSPNGGESWEGGTCKVIRWTAFDPADHTGTLDYKLEYSTDGGANYNTIVTLKDRDQGEQTFCWAVPDTASSQCRVRITATTPDIRIASDASDSGFTVTAASGIQEETIDLKAGWNLISLQLMPVCCPSNNTSCAACSYPIESVLKDVLDKVSAVWYWTGGSSGEWLSYAPGAPSSLTTMTDGKAYWVYAKNDCEIRYLGRRGPAGGGLPPQPYSYVPGWNMVGFKSTTAKTVQTYLGGTCGTTYVAPIYAWGAGSQRWQSPSCTDNMRPGKGYFVYFNSAHSVNPGAD